MVRPQIFWAGDSGVGFMPHPRGNEWLADEIESLRRAGVDVLVSLLTHGENVRLGLDQEKTLAERAGMIFISFPIADHSVPAFTGGSFEVIHQLAALNAGGHKIVTHCFAGIGRSSTIAACVLVERGIAPEKAIEMLSAARGFEVPETEAQAEWIFQYASQRKD